VAKVVALLAVIAIAARVIELHVTDVTLYAPDVGTSFGIWLALVAAVATAAGAYLHMHES
jgi:hypothetical protein